MRVQLRCYAELNDELPSSQRQRDVSVLLDTPATVKDLVESLRIPRAGIELVLVNGLSCSMDQSLKDEDRVSLYPLFEAMDVTPVLRLRPRPLRDPRFLADAHLGRLARYLRLLGFDTLFANDPGDAALAQASAAQNRILLTRDRELLKRRLVTHGLRVPRIRPRDQVVWIAARLDLYRLFRPFTRCTVCNGLLEEIGGESARDLVPPRVFQAFDTFWRCEGCAQVYWRGSHYERLRAFVDEILIGSLGRR